MSGLRLLGSIPGENPLRSMTREFGLALVFWGAVALMLSQMSESAFGEAFRLSFLVFLAYVGRGRPLSEDLREWLFIRGVRRGDFFAAGVLDAFLSSVAHGVGFTVFLLIVPGAARGHLSQTTAVSQWPLMTQGSYGVLPVVSLLLVVLSVKLLEPARFSFVTSASIPRFLKRGVWGWALRGLCTRSAVVTSLLVVLLFSVVPRMNDWVGLSFLGLLVIVELGLAGGLSVTSEIGGTWARGFRKERKGTPFRDSGSTPAPGGMSRPYAPFRGIVWEGSRRFVLATGLGIVFVVSGVVLLKTGGEADAGVLFVGPNAHGQGAEVESALRLKRSVLFSLGSFLVISSVVGSLGYSLGTGLFRWSLTRDHIEYLYCRGVGLKSLIRWRTLLAASQLTVLCLVGCGLGVFFADTWRLCGLLLTPLWVLCFMPVRGETGLSRFVSWMVFPISCTPILAAVAVGVVSGDESRAWIAFGAVWALVLVLFLGWLWRRTAGSDFRSLSAGS